MSDNISQENKFTGKRKTFLKSGKFRIILAVIVLLVSVLTIKSIAFAKHIHKFKDNPHGFLIEKLSENLNLTAEQKAQVEKIGMQIKEKMESKKQQREDMFSQFAEEFKKENPDKNKMMEEMKKKELESQEMKEFMMDKIIEFHSILTPDQRIKAVENMKNMKHRFHEKMEMFKDRND